VILLALRRCIPSFGIMFFLSRLFLTSTLIELSNGSRNGRLCLEKGRQFRVAKHIGSFTATMPTGLKRLCGPRNEQTQQSQPATLIELCSSGGNAMSDATKRNVCG